MAEAKTQPSQEFEKVLKDSATDVASFERHDKPLIERIQHVLHSNPALVPLIVLVLSVAIFGAVLGSKFFSPFALTLILQQVAIVGIVGSAQTLVVLTAGIDLSVGAIMVLSSVVMGQFTFRYGLPAPISILCGFAVGGLIGYANGYLVAKIKLPPFIVTLGMWQIVLATNFLYSRNEATDGKQVEHRRAVERQRDLAVRDLDGAERRRDAGEGGEQRVALGFRHLDQPLVGAEAEGGSVARALGRRSPWAARGRWRRARRRAARRGSSAALGDGHAGAEVDVMAFIVGSSSQALSRVFSGSRKTVLFTTLAVRVPSGIGMCRVSPSRSWPSTTTAIASERPRASSK